MTSGAKAEGRFGKQDFVYSPEEDVYRDGKPTSSRGQIVAKVRGRFAEADIKIAELKEKGAKERPRQEEFKKDHKAENSQSECGKAIRVRSLLLKSNQFRA